MIFMVFVKMSLEIRDIESRNFKKDKRFLWEVLGTPPLEVLHPIGTAQTGIHLVLPHFEIHSASLGA